MGKKETISLLVKGGAATGGPPLGPALGPLGVPVNKVVSAINEKTAALKGMDVPVKVIVDVEAKTFEIEVGTPPTAALLKKEAGIEKGSPNPKETKVSNIAIEQAIKIAKTKAEALATEDLKGQVKQILGTCVSLGLEVEGKDPRQVIKELDQGVYDKELSKAQTEVPAEKAKQIQARAAALRAAAEAKKKES